MAGAAEVVAATRDLTAHLDVTLWALVPNVKGAELATAAGVDHLTVTVSASPAYSEKNIRMTIGQAFDELASIRRRRPGRGARRGDLVLFRLAVRRRARSRPTTSSRPSSIAPAPPASSR